MKKKKEKEKTGKRKRSSEIKKNYNTEDGKERHLIVFLINLFCVSLSVVPHTVCDAPSFRSLERSSSFPLSLSLRPLPLLVLTTLLPPTIFSESSVTFPLLCPIALLWG